MRTAFGVVGANYGDEGKGRNVDALVRRLGPDAIVVRSNGGAQAGHTVVTPDGRRHVFHHIGSGAFAGAATHLSRFFVHHPMTFMPERDDLEGQGACVDVTADPRGLVTTPWDMMVNQVLEVARGGSRHGSCGYGLGETVGRNEETPHRLAFADLGRPGLADLLSRIRDEWLPSRLAALGVTADAETAAAIASPQVMDRFIEDCMMFRSTVRMIDDAALGMAPILVFEGAQGLLLDQRGRDFPHVTRSNTGVQNMAAIAVEAGIDSIELHYATRCYLTRHGAGPLPEERDLSMWFDVVDATNVPNPWQSSIRYGLLDLDLLGRAIHEDISKSGRIRVDPVISVSCLDQVSGPKVPVIVSGRQVMVEAGDLPSFIADRIGVPRHVQWWSAHNRDVGLAA